VRDGIERGGIRLVKNGTVRCCMARGSVEENGAGAIEATPAARQSKSLLIATTAWLFYWSKRRRQGRWEVVKTMEEGE
jgi:hypothetical protein